MTSFRPGLCSVTFRRLAPEEVIALALEGGIMGLEWAGDVHVPPGDFETAAHVGRLTEKAGLFVASYGSYISPPSDDQAAFAIALETARALGAPNIRIWPGSRNRDSITYSADERRHTTQLIRRMAKLAYAASVTVSLEYHPGSLTDDLASAQQLIEEIADRNVFLYWQPRPGLPLEDALEEVVAVGGGISHMHVFAWDRERKRYGLADQRDYWRRILMAAPETRWSKERYAMLEFVKEDSPEQFIEDASTFRGLLEEVQDRSLHLNP